MTRPIDVATRATVAFIAAHVAPGATILEVGCGAGEVAVELRERGFQVTGVDADPASVARAQARGAPVRLAAWPEFRGAAVDALVFSRSLHHMRPLHLAIGKAREVLRPAGTLLVEDFAFDEADAATIAWFVQALRSRQGRELVAQVPGEFVTALLAAADPVAEWRRSHDHELHTATVITEAVARSFRIQVAESVPYLFRYLVPVLPETSEAAEFVEEVLREELRLGEAGKIVGIGRRIVGAGQPAAVG